MKNKRPRWRIKHLRQIGVSEYLSKKVVELMNKDIFKKP